MLFRHTIDRHTIDWKEDLYGRHKSMQTDAQQLSVDMMRFRQSVLQTRPRSRQNTKCPHEAGQACGPVMTMAVAIAKILPRHVNV